MLGQLTERDVASIGDMAGRPFAGFAHIEHHGVLAVDQQRRLGHRDALAAATNQRIDQHAAADRGGMTHMMFCCTNSI